MSSRLISVLFVACAGLAMPVRGGAEAPPAAAPYFFVAGGDPAKDRLPLESTRATVEIAGAIARVRYQQRFKNTGARPLEAVYVFPASTRVAVHEMRVKIGARVIEARIDRKDRAKQAYAAAKADGNRAALLDQERANVFTTRVANVMPGDVLEVELDGSELLLPERGVYSVVVPYTPAGAPASYEWDVRVHVETGGVPLHDVDSPSHDVAVVHTAAGVADIALTPNNDAGSGDRDFVLRYRLAGDRIETGLLMSPPDARGDGFFALTVEPPKAIAEADVPPRECVFVVDVSGSMRGFPLDTVKVLMRSLFSTLRSEDRFNVVLFSGTAYVMSPQGSVAATEENLRRAQRVLEQQDGGGATDLLGGLERAYGVPRAATAGSRTVVVITNGHVGVDAESFRFVRARLGVAKAFALGIGSGVNRALIENIARAGCGEPFVVTSPDEAEAVAGRLRAYIDRPLLSRVQVSFEGLATFDVAPARQGDLMAERPLVVFGKYRGVPQGRVVVTGVTGQGPWRAEVTVDARRVRGDLAALRWLWARKHAEWIEDERSIAPATAKDEALAELGLRYGLLTSMTSFLAIDVRGSFASDLTCD